ncbi:MAG: hypothetical protein ACJ741_00970 [Pyrinomonadaceae bacterium]
MILTVSAFLFVVFTASINAAQSMGGPMNMSPSSEGWFYIVLALDALFLLAAFGGIKLLGLSSRLIGILSLLVGVIILMLGIRNHVNAPPLDGVNDTNKMPVPPFLHYAVYSLVGICLIGGSWLIATGFVRKGVR